MLQIYGREIAVVTFDLEGTIIDLEPQHHRAHALTARDYGVNIDLGNFTEAQEMIPHLIGGPTEKIAEEVMMLSPTVFTAEEYIRRDRRYFYKLRDSMDRIEPRHGFLELFDQLKSLGIKTAIGSLTPREEAYPLLEKSGLVELFDPRTIILGDDVEKGREKPMPDVYIKTAERVGVGTRDQLVFEDSPRGVMAAVDAGSLAMGMPVYIGNMKAKRDLEAAGAIRVYMGWREVVLQRYTTPERQVRGRERFIL